MTASNDSEGQWKTKPLSRFFIIWLVWAPVCFPFFVYFFFLFVFFKDKTRSAVWAAHRCSGATRSETRRQWPIQFCRHRHTFGLVEELGEATHTSPCSIQRTWQCRFVAMSAARAGALFCWQTRCCGSVDGNAFTSQTIQTEKRLTSPADGMPWSFADSLEEASFRDAPQSSRAAQKSLLPVCQTLWVNRLTPEQNSPPHILIYLYFRSYIYNSAIQMYQNNSFVQPIVLSLCCAVHLGMVMDCTTLHIILVESSTDSTTRVSLMFSAKMYFVVFSLIFYICFGIFFTFCYGLPWCVFW